MRREKSDITLARAAVEDHFRDNPNITRENMVIIVKQLLPAPDIRKLVDQYYGRQANYIARSIKDKRNQRSVFYSKIKGVDTYINVDTTNNLEDVQQIKNDLTRKEQGYAQSLEKVDTVIEQLSFDFKPDDKEDEKTKCH